MQNFKKFIFREEYVTNIEKWKIIAANSSQHSGIAAKYIDWPRILKVRQHLLASALWVQIDFICQL
jgi:hypothetical protein